MNNLDPQYIVDWLNYWLDNVVKINDLIDHRIKVFPISFNADDSKYPLVTNAASMLGLLGVLNSLLYHTGTVIIAHYNKDNRLNNFSLTENTSYEKSINS